MSALKNFARVACVGLLFALASVCALAIPASIAPSPSTNGNFTLYWSGGSGFYVEVWQVGVGYIGRSDSGTSGSWLFTGKSNGTYSYYVKNCTPYWSGYNCTGSESEAVLVTVNISVGQPSSFTSSVGSTSYDGSYTLSWGAATQGVVHYYSWSEDSGANWNNTTALTTGPLVRTNGTRYYQVKACNNTSGCSDPRYLTVTVDLNQPPTISPSTLNSANGVYTISWGAGRFNGRDFTHVWIYEDGTANWVAGPKANGQPGNLNNPGSYTRSQGTRNYYVKACYDVSYNQSLEPNPTGTCQNSNTVLITTDVPTPPTVAPAFDGIEAAYDTDGSFNIRWTTVANATSYQIAFGKVGETKTGGSMSTLGNLVTSTFSGLLDGVWEFEIKAYNAAGEFSTTVVSKQVSRTPSAPQGFTSNDGATSYDGSYNLTWTPPAIGAVTKYLWREGNGTWVDVGTGLSSAVINRGNGSYTYEVQACNTTCGPSATVTMSVVLNVAPTISPSTLNSTTGIYTISWGGGRLNGKDFTHFWIYEDGVANWVAGPKANGQPGNLNNPGSYTKTTQATRNYYVRACYEVSFNQGLEPLPTTGTCQNSNTIQIITDFPVPPMPTGLAFSNIEGAVDTDGAFNLGWADSAASGTTQYKVRWGKSGNTKTITPQSAPAMAFSALTDGIWDIEVQACNRADECSAWTALVSKEVKIKPSAPQGFTSNDGATSYDGSYNLTWTAPAIGAVTKYLWREGNGTWVDVGTNLSSAIINRGNNSYSYEVQACNVTCGPSATVTISVVLNVAPTISPSTLNSATGIYTISWGGGRLNGKDFTHFWIYEDGVANWVAGPKANGQPGNLNNPGSYTKTTQATRNYYVRACYEVSFNQGLEPLPTTGTCQNSNTIQIITDFPVPPVPTGLAFSNIEGAVDTDGAFNLGWADSAASGTTQYKVRWGKSGNTKTITPQSAPAMAFTALTDGIWEIEVQACNRADECSAWTTLVSKEVKLKPSAPQSFSSSDTTASYDGTYNLTWAAPAVGAVTYYQWREGSGSWVNVGTNLSSAAITRGNGTYTYEVQACNVTCGPSATVTISVVLNIAPTISASTLNSANGIYSVSWGGGRMNGTDFTHLWVYENGVATWVSGTRPAGYPLSVYSNPVSYTQTTQGTRSYYVRACYGVSFVGQGIDPDPNTGTCQNSNTIQIITDFPSPQPLGPITFNGVETSVDTNGILSFSWDPVGYAVAYSGTTTYNVRYGLGSARGSFQAVPSRTFAPATLADGVWEFDIQACNHVGECVLSTVSKTVKRIPSIPQNLTSSDGTLSVDGVYNLSWGASSVGSVDYYQWRENGGAWNKVYSGLVSATITHDPGSYSYELQACNVNCSDTVTLTVSVAPLDAPTGVSTSLDQTSGVPTVSWQAVANATSYKVQPYLNGSTAGTLLTVGAGTLSTTVSALTQAGNYSYGVQACGVIGGVARCSVMVVSNTVALQIPGIPQIASPLANTTGSYKVSWSSVVGATTYELFENNVSIQKSASLQKLFEVLEAKQNGVYYYQVRACRILCSGLSNIAVTSVILPPLPAVPAKPVAALVNGKWRVSWNAISGATRYSLVQVNAGQTNTLELGTNYHLPTVTGVTTYKVKACIGTRCSGFSPELSVDLTAGGANSSSASSVDTTQPQVTLTDGSVSEVVPNDIPTSAIVGTTGAQFKVDESGAATYTIPIPVPPGVAGVQPQLALGYSSNAGIGIAGQGFSLSGLSVITRCRQTLSQDNKAMPITWSADDRFCLNGQRLMVVSGNYGAPNSVYRTEIDSFVEVTAKGGTSGHPDYFTVEAKDGSTSYLGNTADAKLAGSSAAVATTTLSWSINRFQDSVGNSIDYNYEGDAGTGQRLATIRYAFGSTNSGTAAQRIDSSASLAFVYETRNDASSAYVAGYAFGQTRRLATIIVNSNGQEVRRFTLGYMPETTANNERYYNRISRLQSVTECKGSTCLVPITFTWGGGSHIQFPSSADQTVTYVAPPAGQYLLNNFFADVTGDGRQELVYLMYEKAQPNGSYPYRADMAVHVKYPGSEQETVIKLTANNYQQVQVASLDYNADGRQDLALYDGAQWRLYIAEVQAVGADYDWRIPVSFVTDAALTNPDTSFMDYNTDGLMDAVTLTGYLPLIRDTAQPVSSARAYKFGSLTAVPVPALSVYTDMNNYIPAESGCSPSNTWQDVMPGTATDFDGDGVTDVLVSVNRDYLCTNGGFHGFSRNYRYALVNRNNQMVKYGDLLYGNKDDLKNTYPVDLNGDGLVDLVYYMNNNTVYYQLNTGKGFASASLWVQLPSPGSSTAAQARPRFLDLNSDGATDIVWYDSTSAKLKYRLWGETSDRVLSEDNLSNADTALLMDVSGDGIVDMVRVSSNKLLVNLGSMAVGIPDIPCQLVTIPNTSRQGCMMVANASEAVPANEQTTGIVRINNGLDNLTNIYYGTLATSRRYATTDTRPANTVGLTPCDPNNPRCTPVLRYMLDSSAFYTRLNGGWSLPTGSVVLQANNTLGTTNTSKGAPVLEVNGAMRIVTTVESSAPTPEAPEGKSRVEYYYGEAKMQASGRGFLGFNTLATVLVPQGTADADSGITTVTTYRQDFPFMGSPLSTVVYDSHKPTAKVLSVATNRWNANAGAAAGIYQPYIESGKEESYGYGTEALLQTVTTGTTTDSEGNPTDITVTTTGSGETLTKNTANTYSTDPWEKRKGRLTRVVVKTNGQSDTQRTSTFSYYGVGDGALRGLLKTETVEPDNSDATLTTTYGYDGFGNKKTAATTGKNALGATETRTTTNNYDAGGRYLVSSVNDLNQSASITDRNGLGQATVSTDINGVIASVSYDALGNEYLRQSTTGAWVRTDTTYCNNNCPAGAKYRTDKRMSGGGKTTEYFDILGRVIRSSKVNFDGTNVFVDTDYDSLGRVKRQSVPYTEGTASASIYWTTNTYDALNRVIAVKAPDEGITTSVYTNLETLITNPLGKTVKETRNGLGQLVKVTDHLGGTIAYTYTPKGDLLSALTTAIEGNTALVLMCYDNLGRKIGMMDEDKGGFKATVKTCDGFNPNTPPAGWWSYQYDAFGELIKQRDPKGQTSTMTYDIIGRMTSRLDKLADNTADANTAWFYDKPFGSSTDTPATRGKLTAVIMNEFSSPITGTASDCGGANHCTLYSYDDRARLSDTTVFLPNESTGFTSGTRFDAIGRPYQEYDGLNGVLGVSGVQTQYNPNGYAYQTVNLQDQTLLSRTQSLNARGQVTSELRGNGLITTNTYYPDSGLLNTQITNNGSGIGSDIQNNTYTWDKVGNLTSRNSSGKTLPSGSKNLTETFAYDDLNRLIRSEIGGASNPHNCNGNDVSYNGLGNITCKGNLTNYQYGTNAGPHAVTRTTNGGIDTSYTYDNNGNQTSDGNATASRRIEYTSYDLVKKISKGTALTSELKYGPDRMRWQRKDLKSGITTTTTYLGNLERIQSSSNSAVVEWKRYVGGSIFTYKLDNNMTPLSGEDSYDRRYVYTDHLGSLDVITNSRGIGTVLTNRLSYDAWGSRRNSNTWATISTATRINEVSIASYGGVWFTQPVTTRGFTGHEMADDYGIINMNGRIYDPLLGRFLQADPFIDGVKNTQGYNRYSYVQNNPLNASDPSGFSVWTQFRDNVVRPLAGTIVAIALTVFAPEGANVWYAAFVGGASGAVGAAANGGNILRGALTGAIGGAAFYGVGQGMQHLAGVKSFGAASLGMKAAWASAQGAVGGIMAVAQGGKFGNGFASAFVTKVANVNDFMGSEASMAGARVMVAAIIGGTVSEMTGGKFANGAATAALMQAVNGENENRKKEAYKAKISNALADPEVKKFLHAIRQAEFNHDSIDDRDEEEFYKLGYGFKNLDDLSDHPAVLAGSTKQMYSGAYQIGKTTWLNAKAALDLADFSANSQDLAAVYLIDQRGQLNNIMSGNWETALPSLAKEWASLPQSKSLGSFYKQPNMNFETLKAHYEHF